MGMKKIPKILRENINKRSAVPYRASAAEFPFRLLNKHSRNSPMLIHRTLALFSGAEGGWGGMQLKSRACVGDAIRTETENGMNWRGIDERLDPRCDYRSRSVVLSFYFPPLDSPRCSIRKDRRLGKGRCRAEPRLERLTSYGLQGAEPA
ncbi:unnamed protein product, partial [Iphiclides podalirius]